LFLRKKIGGAVEWIRTTTVLLPPAPQAGASASSATTAWNQTSIAELTLWESNRGTRNPSTSQPHQEYFSVNPSDKYLDEAMKRITGRLDANDFLYAVSASRNYDPSARLESIKAAVMFINSADDFINPPELGIAEREIKRVKNGKFVLLPASEQTYGHGTHTVAAAWQSYLKELLDRRRETRKAVRWFAWIADFWHDCGPAIIFA
jgi:homoserine acetyltransferase